MDIGNIPLLDTLRQRMTWLNARQNVLSQNVANADTPGFVAQDLKPLDFARMLDGGGAPALAAPALERTNPLHIAGIGAPDAGYRHIADTSGEANPTGNNVSLEQQMIKVADTQAQYQAASNLYAKAVRMMRTAIGH